ncbi:MAG: hypothetical protein AAF725_14600, partial [Acidobacteriota bacterium]
MFLIPDSFPAERQRAFAAPPATLKKHYLEDELYRLIQEDPRIFDFLEASSLDGLWYWDLENPEHEWMSDRFWQTLGFDPDSRPHLASSWKD